MKTAPGVDRKPFLLITSETNSLRFCRRPSRCRLPHWWLLRRPFLLRDVFFLYLGFVPVQEKRRIGIVGRQGPSEVDRAAFFNACCCGLTDYLHVHVGRRGLFKLIIARHERNLEQNGVRSGHDFDHLAGHFNLPLSPPAFRSVTTEAMVISFCAAASSVVPGTE